MLLMSIMTLYDCFEKLILSFEVLLNDPDARALPLAFSLESGAHFAHSLAIYHHGGMSLQKN